MSEDVLGKKDLDNKKKSLWSNRGFYMGMGLGAIVFFLEGLILFNNSEHFPYAERISHSPAVLGFILVILLGIRARKFGYLTGFIAGIFIALGLILLLFLAVCSILGSYL